MPTNFCPGMVAVKHVCCDIFDLLFIWLQDVLEVEEYLWNYIEKYCSDKVQIICNSGVTYIYASDKLEMIGINAETVKNATEEVVALCQKVADNIVEETFSLPQDMHGDVLQTKIKDVTENESLLCYLGGNSICHVVGPKEKVSALKQHILDIVSVSAQKNRGVERKLEGIASEAGKPSTATKSMSDRCTLITPGGITLEVYQGDLVAETVDAIVNPANSYLRHGGGAARVIAEAAGSQLENECRDFIRQHKHLDVTRVMHTSAGKLRPNIKYVIHAVGPQAAKYPNANVLFEALRETFFNCLQHADHILHACSLSIPAISSGICYSCV